VSHVLELTGIDAGYGRLPVLHGVDLAVPEGATVALLGPNGAGKSTLLGAAVGTVAVTAGQVRLDGVGVTRLGPTERARRGLVLVPEGRGIFPGLSVADNLALGAAAAQGHSRAWRARQTARVLELFPRLGERARQRAGSLSGGEQQMLAMSRAFLGAPRVLLLDEISMGLAPQVVEQLYAAVGELRTERTSILLVEQYLTYALRLADVCYLLSKGRVAFVGEPGELAASPAVG